MKPGTAWQIRQKYWKEISMGVRRDRRNKRQAKQAKTRVANAPRKRKERARKAAVLAAKIG